MHVQQVVARSFASATAFLLLLPGAANAESFSDRLVRGYHQTVDGLGIVLALFCAVGVLACLAGGGKKGKKRASRGPIGGSHTAEGMIFDKHYDNVPAVWAARRARDKIMGD